MTCGSCGAGLIAGARFCPSCGVSAPGVQAPRRSPTLDTTWPLILAILTTVFCCQPFGIVAIVFAVQAGSLAKVGDHDGAADKVRQSNFWAYLGIAIIGGLLVLYVLFIVVMMVLPAVLGGR